MVVSPTCCTKLCLVGLNHDEKEESSTQCKAKGQMLCDLLLTGRKKRGVEEVKPGRKADEAEQSCMQCRESSVNATLSGGRADKSDTRNALS